MAYTLVIRRYAPFSTFGLGFEGDHRTEPSLDIKATARTIGMVAFDRNNVGNVGAYSSGTRWTQFGIGIADFFGTYKSNVVSSVSVKSCSIDSIYFLVSTAGANPFPIVSLISPKIETFVSFRAVFSKTILEVSGLVKGDDFPNVEILLYDNIGSAILLFDFRTTGGKESGPFTRLPLSHQDQVLGKFSGRISTSHAGNFDTVASAGAVKW